MLTFKGAFAIILVAQISSYKYLAEITLQVPNIQKPKPKYKKKKIRKTYLFHSIAFFSILYTLTT